MIFLRSNFHMPVLCEQILNSLIAGFFIRHNYASCKSHEEMDTLVFNTVAVDYCRRQ